MAGALDLEREIQKSLEEYGSKLRESVEKSAEKISKRTVQELKSKSPKRKGNYAKSWTVKKNEEAGYHSFVVHNKEHYRLTHLLEYGHQKINGGRTKAIPHIKDVEEQAIRDFEKEVTELAEKG